MANAIRTRGVHPILRFWSHVTVDAESGCWNWSRVDPTTGYGRLYLNERRKKEYAHRFSYAIHSGPLVLGMDIDHLCRNRACCNPDHLEQVSHAENVRRGESGARRQEATHCLNGHEWTPNNTHLRTTSQGRVRRVCRACDKARSNAKRERLAELAEKHPELVPHGTPAAYKKWGCRCERCRDTFRKKAS